MLNTEVQPLLVSEATIAVGHILQKALDGRIELDIEKIEMTTEHFQMWLRSKVVRTAPDYSDIRSVINAVTNILPGDKVWKWCSFFSSMEP